MRFSHLFGNTLRESPADAELPSHRMALRAGLIRPIAQGIYALLPTGWRVMRRIEAIIRQEMDAIGGQEMLMPMVQPAELWQASGRYQAPSPGPALVRFQDRSGRPLVLAMTHEEVITELARAEIRSYRQLPCLVYQIQCKFRDEPRARGGLLRVREFLMKDAYSLDANAEGMAAAYARVYAAYERILARCELDVIAVEADSGMMGGHVSHEFMAPNPQGEDTLLRCQACGHAANAEGARIGLGPARQEPEQPLEMVATPGCATIAQVAEYLGVAPSQTLKAVFFQSTASPDTATAPSLVFAVIRGDLEVNVVKLSAALGGAELTAAGTEALGAAGITPGYASPVGVRGVTVVADESVLGCSNSVAGANVPGYHLCNVNVPRDFQPDLITDIALAREDDPCPRCGAPLGAVRAIEVGHIFQLGTRYTEAMGATYLNAEGRATPLWMGCYGIGVGRLLACILEQHHDEAGPIWPAAVAPYDVHLVSLTRPGAPVEGAAEGLYRDLVAAGLSVLYDDRPERAGVKFNDADLIGAPVRLTLGERNLGEGVVELKRRCETEVVRAPLAPTEALVARIRAALSAGHSPGA